MIEELMTLLSMDPDVENPHDYHFYGHCMLCGMLDLIPFSMYPMLLCDGCYIDDDDYYGLYE